MTVYSRSLPSRTRTEIKVNFDHVCRNINNSRSVQLFPQIQIYSDRGDVCLLTLPLYKSLLTNYSSQNPHLKRSGYAMAQIRFSQKVVWSTSTCVIVFKALIVPGPKYRCCSLLYKYNGSRMIMRYAVEPGSQNLSFQICSSS